MVEIEIEEANVDKVGTIVTDDEEAATIDTGVGEEDVEKVCVEEPGVE